MKQRYTDVVEFNKKKNTKRIGDLGENLACKHLRNKGFSIIQQNYLKKWGEIDIVAKGPASLSDDSVTHETKLSGRNKVTHETIVHFIEVKTLSYDSKEKLEYAVTHETWRPEEQVHRFKLHQIGKAIETWISEHGYTGNWQIDVVAVRVVPEEKFASIKMIENVIA